METVQEDNGPEAGTEIIPYEFTQDYITDAVKNYEPCERDLFIENKKINDYQRLVWGAPLEMREREIENWQKFEDYIKENELENIPEYYTNE
mgnify:CR=1 FL=1